MNNIDSFELEMNGFHLVDRLPKYRYADVDENGNGTAFGRDIVSYDVSADEAEVEFRAGALEGVVIDAELDAGFIARTIARAAKSGVRSEADIVVSAHRVLARSASSDLVEEVFGHKALRKAVLSAAYETDLAGFTACAVEFPSILCSDPALDAEDREEVIREAMASEKAIDASLDFEIKHEVARQLRSAPLAKWMNKRLSSKHRARIVKAAQSTKRANVKKMDDGWSVRKAGWTFDVNHRGVITSAKRI